MELTEFTCPMHGSPLIFTGAVDPTGTLPYMCCLVCVLDQVNRNARLNLSLVVVTGQSPAEAAARVRLDIRQRRTA